MNEIYARHWALGTAPARGTIFVVSLPHGAEIEYTGVAVRDLSKRTVIYPKNFKTSATASPCVIGGEWMYCSGKSGFITGVNGGIFHPIRECSYDSRCATFWMVWKRQGLISGQQ